ncbi:MAG: hypothetical protein KF678_15615 [Phycisphaeraceae bacterium]|nr:hypothetical protein [Phycisphaeraceae bacterium]
MTSAPKQAGRATGSVPITTTARFVVPGRERAAALSEHAPQPVSPGRVPRVARLMALAIRFDALLREGAVSTQAELAAVGHVTRARVTQIMNLLHLAPDLQEAVLHLPLVQSGRDPITEHDLRPICALVDWDDQRCAWFAGLGSPAKTCQS